MLKILLDNTGTEDRPMYHACDTEVAYISVADQTPVGHGQVTCFSVFIGPDVNRAQRRRQEKLVVGGHVARRRRGVERLQGIL